MEKREYIESIGGFSKHTVFSQVSAIVTLVSTNFLEVSKIRLINDLK